MDISQILPGIGMSAGMTTLLISEVHGGVKQGSCVTYKLFPLRFPQLFVTFMMYSWIFQLLLDEITTSRCRHNVLYC